MTSCGHSLCLIAVWFGLESTERGMPTPGLPRSLDYSRAVCDYHTMNTPRSATKTAALFILVASLACKTLGSAPLLQPVVEAEEDVYSYVSADNGAGPLWCGGSTCLVRSGGEVFASGLETIKGLKPLNNCRWLLFHRASNGWQLAQADPEGRTREPAPLAGFPDGQVFLSVNPTLTASNTYNGPARPRASCRRAKPPQ